MAPFFPAAAPAPAAIRLNAGTRFAPRLALQHLSAIHLFADTSLFRWMGGITQDHQGNIAMGYSGSSSTVFPSVYVTGRLNGDALNTMESEVQLYAGLNSQVNLTGYAYGYRWGDYTAMMPDPDDCTFWYTGEYLKLAGLFNSAV